MLDKRLPVPAYDHLLKLSHTFNLLDARGAVGVTERAECFAALRNLARQVTGPVVWDAFRSCHRLWPRCELQACCSEFAAQHQHRAAVGKWPQFSSKASHQRHDIRTVRSVAVTPLQGFGWPEEKSWGILWGPSQLLQSLSQ